ncbi:g12909 [Coccomyxa viridis]|uniref:G12909 protein n=1 Tax=Coccomyxa viridis TaxID=1274662 RepID=A0ABP1GIL9_9CHLO
MLVCLNQIAHVSLVCLPVLLALEIRISRAVPCVDLYKDVHRPKVYSIDDIEEVSPIHGLAHKTICGMHHHGMKELEMWMQTLVPGTAIPPHTHGGEEVVIALKGIVTFNSLDPNKQVQVQTLSSNDTIVILPGVVHSFSNVGDEDVQLMIALTGDIHPMVYPRWGADASEAQRMEPLAFDTRPSKDIHKQRKSFDSQLGEP